MLWYWITKPTLLFVFFAFLLIKGFRLLQQVKIWPKLILYRKFNRDAFCFEFEFLRIFALFLFWVLTLLTVLLGLDPFHKTLFENFKNIRLECLIVIVLAVLGPCCVTLLNVDCAFGMSTLHR